MVAHPSGGRFRSLQRLFWQQNPPGTPCWLCGEVIDQTISCSPQLPGRRPNPLLRWSRSIDHVIPLAAGGPELDISLWRPAHYGHNSSRGDGTRPRVTTTVTRTW